MCGIAGLAGRLACGPPQERDDRVSRSLEVLRHRGPDGGGVWSSAELPVALGHRRLSVIDVTSAAAQPMAIEGGRHVVTYNGEVYNYKELRGRLERDGCRLRTRSDTEVLLLACRVWGPLEAVRRARGMFAFAYLDGPSRQLWLIRDRFGEKPLYWSLLDGSVIFASELKALVELTGSRPAVDRQSLATFLARGAVAQPASIYDGVQQVPAGTALCIRVADAITQQDIARHRHWDPVGEALRAARSPFQGTLDDAAAAVHAELRRSVRAATVADRPVGVFLSGRCRLHAGHGAHAGGIGTTGADVHGRVRRPPIRRIRVRRCGRLPPGHQAQGGHPFGRGRTCGRSLAATDVRRAVRRPVAAADAPGRTGSPGGGHGRALRRCRGRTVRRIQPAHLGTAPLRKARSGPEGCAGARRAGRRTAVPGCLGRDRRLHRQALAGRRTRRPGAQAGADRRLRRRSRPLRQAHLLDRRRYVLGGQRRGRLGCPRPAVSSAR